MAATNGNGRVSRAAIGEEISAVSRDFPTSINTFSRYFLRQEDSGVLARGKGQKYLDILRDVEKDTRVNEGLSQRYGAVLARETVVEPASDSKLDKKVADEVKRQINGLSRRNTQASSKKGAVYSFGGFDQFTLGMLDAIFMGYSASEIDWATEDNRVYVRQIWNRDQSRFLFNVADGGYELRLITPQSLLEGEALPERKFLVNTYGSKIGDPY